MKGLAKYHGALMLYWLVVFFFHRLFFIFYQWPVQHKVHSTDQLILALFEGYRLDLSTATILLLLPLTLTLVFYITRRKAIQQGIYLLVSVLLFLYCLVGIGDAGLYREWNAKLNLQALAHFSHPSEVFKTMSAFLILLYFTCVGFFYFFLHWLYRRRFHPLLHLKQSHSDTKRYGYALIYFLVSVSLGIILIRGGITNIPINQSVAYFSPDAFANDVAVNPLYNLLQDATIQSNIPAPEQYRHFTPLAAKQLIAPDIHFETDSTVHILNEDRPNLVFIFLESWSADNVGCLGGLSSCTPQFDSLSRESLLFTHAYANAYVSDQGIPAVLSACPSVSRVAFINQPVTVPSLPCISEELRQQGYSTSFLFGGDLVYGNLRGYLLEKKFMRLVEQKDLTQYPHGRLGVHDAYTFPELLRELDGQKPPFLQGFFTVSSHMPYDYEATDTWASAANDPEKKYTEAVHYSDIQLGKFFREAKTRPWYPHTLFVVVADHSHNSIRQWDPATAMHARIPLLFTGGALQAIWKGKTWDKIVSQLDLAGTLLNQLHFDFHRYLWTRNIFSSKTPSSAFYVFFGGVGMVNDKGYVGLRQGDNDHIQSTLQNNEEEQGMKAKAQAFQQLVYDALPN